MTEKKHEGVFERIKEIDHDLLVEDLETATEDGGVVTDDAVDDVNDGKLVEVDPETLTVDDLSQ